MGPDSTQDPEYTERLERLQGAGWKRFVDVQRPYRWYLERLKLGFTLDVGCGIGRNLANLNGNGVGVDHNAASVAVARRRGFKAFTPEEFRAGEYSVAGRFDALLCSHVVEHLVWADAVSLLLEYLPFVTGRVVIVTPQEAGFRSDPTHLTFMDFDALRRLLAEIGLVCRSANSRPFPRPVGRVFKYNEFVVVGSRPSASGGSRPTTAPQSQNAQEKARENDLGAQNDSRQ